MADEVDVDGLAVHSVAAAVHSDGAKIIEVRLEVASECHGWRADRFLRRRIPRLSRTRIQRILDSQVTRTPARGKSDRLKPASRVFAGDVLLIRRPARPEPVCPRDFALLYEDDALLVLDKPAGLPIHPTARYYRNTLTAVLSERYPGMRLQPAHRLDRETSGVLLVAKGRAAGSALKRAFAARQVEKEYLAIAKGELSLADGAEQTIDLPLALDPRGPIRIRMAPCAEGRPAETRVRVVRRLPGYTLVACSPITGRQHQIRAHLAAIGHAVVGDKLYGAPDALFLEWAASGLTEAMLALLELPRQALHAARIAFPHPTNGRRMVVSAPLPADLVAFLARITRW